ncbi:hypothetical protein BKI52_44630 [marine bacterium AO1-C]|nr:hypothetical protein BKI52_44630 [marine bacterium AO1-C]
MLNTAILDIVIALSFTYFILSMMVSSINEAVSNARNYRGNLLRNTLLNLFYEKGSTTNAKKPEATTKAQKTAKGEVKTEPETENAWKDCLNEILDSPFIDSVRKKANQFPSYIPPENFSLATLEFLKEQVKNNDGKYDDNNLLQELKTKLENNEIKLIKGKFKTKLLTLIDKSQNNLDHFKIEIESFYNKSTEQLGSWYKRKIKLILFGYGAILALVFNVDTFHMGKVLWQKPSEATAFIEQIENYKAKKKDTTMTAADSTLQQIANNTIKDIQDNYGTLKPLPIGWNAKEVAPFARILGVKNKAEKATNKFQTTTRDAFFDIFSKLLGWFVTAAAVSLGAPFWYDVFNKVLNIRKSIAPIPPPPASTPQPTAPTANPPAAPQPQAEKPEEENKGSSSE